MFGVYLHIPYCRTRCPYCTFVSRAIDGPVPQSYVEAVCREIAGFQGPDVARSVFFGGGTPSLLDPAMLERMLEALRKRFSFDGAEITLEANPDDITRDLARSWLGLGINRISIGAQSFDNLALQYLGRRHDAKAAVHACEVVAEHFSNWSVDLIFGAHPVESWEPTLRTCVALEPPHVSAYGLSCEEYTVFGAKSREAIDDDLALSLYEMVEEALAAYEHYEISNFAKPGCRSAHNLVYWHNEEYAGFGAGAFSYLDGVRARNLEDHEVYIAQPGRKAEIEKLTQTEIRTETLIQHFRLREGIRKSVYRERFGSELHDDFGPQLDKLILRGLLVENEESIRPTREGFYLNDEIGLALLE